MPFPSNEMNTVDVVRGGITACLVNRTNLHSRGCCARSVKDQRILARQETVRSTAPCWIAGTGCYSIHLNLMRFSRKSGRRIYAAFEDAFLHESPSPIGGFATPALRTHAPENAHTYPITPTKNSPISRSDRRDVRRNGGWGPVAGQRNERSGVGVAQDAFQAEKDVGEVGAGPVDGARGSATTSMRRPVKIFKSVTGSSPAHNECGSRRTRTWPAMTAT